MKKIKFLTVLGGLALGLPAIQAQVTTNLISETTFDPAAASGGTYGYYYGATGTYTIPDPYFAPADINQTNQIRRFNFDATGLDGLNNWGTGTGGSLFRADSDPALFVGGDREDYIFTFDARVEGLLAGQTGANGEMQAQIRLPDADGITKTFQVNLNFRPTATWQTFRFSLQDGGVATGSDKATEEDLAARHDQVSGLNFNVNFHEPYNAFGFDADNALEVDNIKLEVINRGAVVVRPTYAKTIIDWNLDDKGIWYSYPYDWSATAVHAAFTVNREGNTLGKDGTVGWALQMDNSAFAGAVPAYAGGGTGGGGPGDYSVFDSGDLAGYRVSFDARAEGALIPTAAILQIFVAAPDDTLLPADENTDTDTLTQLNFPIAPLTTEWKSYSILFSKATVGGGSKENFANLFNKVSELRTQWQFENAASANDWGFDADNALVVDNIKIERVFTGLQPFTFAVEGNELVLNWTPASTGTTVLQATATIDGTFQDVTTTEPTYRTSTASGNRFFRLSWAP